MNVVFLYFCFNLSLPQRYTDFFARQFTSLFLDPVKDAESFTVSVTTIRYLFPFIFFNVFNNLFHGIIRAVGSGRLMLISTIIYAVSFVSYAYILFAVLPDALKNYGSQMVLNAAYITEVIFAVIIFITGKWKTHEYKTLESLHLKSFSKYN